MPILNSISQMKEEMTKWRQDLHQIPELGFEEFKTSEFIENKLKEWGVKHSTKIGKTGIVAQIIGVKGNSKASIGLRADIDALPIEELNDFNYKSKNKGVSHKCGHDGHTSMLLGAVKYLSENPNFNGVVNFIFQPAEEGQGGARVMIEEGLFKKFPMEQVFGMHNWPEVEKGKFSICSGPIMAGANTIQIKITGFGGHAAMPHQTIDPIIVGSHIVTALQTVSSRTINPMDNIVLSITQFHAGTTHNIIPNEVFLEGSLRTLSDSTKETAVKKIDEIVKNIAKGFSAEAEFSIDKGYPVTVNSEKETEVVSNVASELVGNNNVNSSMTPIMGSEDFSFMLNTIPGAYICIGQKDKNHNKPVHNAEYDFNDDILTLGTTYWGKFS